MKNAGSTNFEFFEDWNPSPYVHLSDIERKLFLRTGLADIGFRLGLFITVC